MNIDFEISSETSGKIGNLTWSPDGKFTFAPDPKISSEHARLMDRAMRSISRAGPSVFHSHHSRKHGDLWSKIYRLKEPPTAEIVSAILKARSLMRDHRVRLVVA